MHQFLAKAFLTFILISFCYCFEASARTFTTGELYVSSNTSVVSIDSVTPISIDSTTPVSVDVMAPIRSGAVIVSLDDSVVGINSPLRSGAVVVSLDDGMVNVGSVISPIIVSGSSVRVSGDNTWIAQDDATNSVTTVTYEHHEIHAGSHYEIVDVVDLSLNNVRDIQITTPNTTKWAHLNFNLSVESETEWYLYENVTIVTPGSSGVPINNDRNSANTSGLTIASIDNTSVSNANADTSTTGAIVLEHGIAGAGKDAGNNERSREVILKQNEDYSLRFIANSAGHVTYNLQWYEHTNKN